MSLKLQIRKLTNLQYNKSIYQLDRIKDTN